MEKIKYALAVLWGLCAGYFQQYGLLYCLVAIAVLMDLISGIAAALIEGALSSKTALKGFGKKLMMLFAVAFGVFLDVLLPQAAALAGIELATSLHFSAVVSAYICITESISILENIYRSTGKRLPGWITQILEIAKEKIANICTYKTSGNVKGVFYPENERQLIMIYQYLK